MSNWLTRSNSKPFETTPIHKFMQSMMDDFWDQRWLPSHTAEKPLSEFTPRMNIKENETSLQVSAELPGLEAKDVDISVDKTYLTISGEKKQETQKDDKGSHYYECSYGSFMRRIPLPFEVNMEKVQANFDKGILKITLDKSDAARQQARKIPIKSS